MICLVELVGHHIIGKLVLRAVEGEVALLVDVVVLSVDHHRTEVACVLECGVVESRLEDEAAVGVELLLWDADRGLEDEVVADDLQV